MSQYNYISVNVKMLQIFGTNTSIYWAELMNVYARVISKKLEETIQNDGYFELDRDYITKRTTLSIPDQLLCDRGLINAEIICYNGKNVNQIRIDVSKMQEILLQDDEEKLSDLQRILKIKKTDESQLKRLGQAQTFKNMIVEPDAEIQQSYFNWIDTIILDKKDFLNRVIVETFVKTIREFTDSKQAQLKIIEIALIQGWKNAAWAIDSYKKDNKSTPTFLGSAQKKNVGIDPNSKF